MLRQQLSSYHEHELQPESNFKLLIVLAFALVALVLAFAWLPIAEGDDWETFYGAARRILLGAPLYGQEVTHSFYSNPPWLAVLVLPLSLLPFRWGWSVLSVISLIMATLAVRRFQSGLFKLALVLLSPPMIYTLLHGQIDALVLGGVLLPPAWWILVAMTKPQVAIGLIFGIRRSHWLRTAIVTGVVLLISMIWFGNWLADLARQPAPFIAATHNVWFGLWPFQVPVGVALILLGMQHQDERYLLAASPFFAPYAALSSLLGPWIAACSGLKAWQAGLVFAAWWGAVAYRVMSGW